MRFVTFQFANRVGAGLLRGREIIDLGLAYFQAFRRPFKFIDIGAFLAQDGLERLDKLDLTTLKHDPKMFLPLEAVTLLAPILRPPKLTCLGLNYRDHAAETGQPLPKHPLLFAKAANAVVGQGADVVIPPESTQVDYEAELAIVIKTPGQRIPVERAMEHVFGFTCLNDISARDIQFGDKQWYRGKSFPTFAPMGPMIVTPDELAAGALPISMTLNGVTVQDGNTSNLVFGIPEIVSFVSHAFDLETGDVISTGTPAGVGFARKPPVYLKDGDNLVLTIEGIGSLRNRVVKFAPSEIP